MIFRLPFLACLILLGLPYWSSASPPSDPISDELGFVKGYTWGWVGSRGSYSTTEAEQSMAKLAETGADHVCIAFAAIMPSATEPDFGWGDDSPVMVTDAEVRHAIHLAKRHDLKVILKPTINCGDHTWRAYIRFYRPLTEQEKHNGKIGVFDRWRNLPTFLVGKTVDDSKWERWWENFDDFLCHYARIAEQEEVDAFCLGCEMSSTEHFVDRWRSTIRDVRDIYHGPITYNCNHGREATLKWWDAVDFISISAYYETPVADGVELETAIAEVTPKSEIVAELERVRERLRRVSKRFNKRILFIETGVTNVQGCARYPWEFENGKLDSPINDQEQVHYYEAMFETFWGESWFMGFAWWDWPAHLYPEEQADEVRSFCVYGRPAEEVLRKWYATEPGSGKR